MYTILITFVKEGETQLNRQTGNREQLTDDEKVKVYANKSHTSANRQELLYGAVRRHAYTLRFQGELDVEAFDYVTFDDDSYQIDDYRFYDLDTVVWVSST